MTNPIHKDARLIELFIVDSKSNVRDLRTPDRRCITGTFDSTGVFWGSFYTYTHQYDNVWLRQRRPTQTRGIDLNFIVKKITEITEFREFAKNLKIPTKKKQ